jgi:hypothetical protein
MENISRSAYSTYVYWVYERRRSFGGVAGYETEKWNPIPKQERIFFFFFAAKMSWPTHCSTCMVDSGVYAAGLWSSPTTCLDLYARIGIRVWNFGCGMGDHGRIPCCSVFRPILELLKLTILQILGGAHQSRMARLNIYLFSISRLGMHAPLHRLTLFALGTGKYSKCMTENGCNFASINFAMCGKWAGS